jgi:hypothetical protein
MRIQAFPLNGESSARLELRWDGAKAQVYFDGAHAATLDGPSGFKKGWSTQLGDGSTLEVRSIRRVLFPELSILRNGEHVSSSPAHPDRMLKSSTNALFAVSIFLIVAGAFSLWGRHWIAAVFGLFYLAGALLLRKRYRIGAAVIALPVIIELDLLLLAAIGGIDRRWVIDFLLNLFFLTFVVRSYQAARDSRSIHLSESAAV